MIQPGVLVSFSTWAEVAPREEGQLSLNSRELLQRVVSRGGKGRRARQGHWRVRACMAMDFAIIDLERGVSSNLFNSKLEVGD